MKSECVRHLFPVKRQKGKINKQQQSFPSTDKADTTYQVVKDRVLIHRNVTFVNKSCDVSTQFVLMLGNVIPDKDAESCCHGYNHVHLAS